MTKMNSFRYSFITVSLNNYRGLEVTLSSISEFANNNKDLSVEVVVIDGGSTDDSPRLFDTFSNLIDVLVVEKDDGIYDAMSKGVDVSSGDFLCFMNTGDAVLKKGMRELINRIDNTAYSYAGTAKWDIRKIGQKVLPFSPKLLRMPNHQAIWFSRNFLVKNPFDKQFPICADLDHKILCFKTNTLRTFDMEVVLSEHGGVSQEITTTRTLVYRSCEHSRVAKKHYGNFWFIVNFLKFFTWNSRKVIKEKIKIM